MGRVHIFSGAPVPPPSPPVDHIDKSLIQINVSDEELQQRIQNFIERKREQVNISNIHDFIPGKEEDQTEDTCARVRTQFVKRSDSKGHLKIRKVCNEWGPQTVSDFSQPEPAASGLPASGVPTASGLPAAIAERVLSVEKFLNIGPVAPDIYKRLKAMEDRIAYLEAISPEYAEFWKSQKEPDEPEQKPAMNFIFSAEDIARKIEQLERMDSM
ncbi:molybdopterin synthase catalytic subunit-like [Choristoneura fumiferana]|uniref:molybdopterin synthase catalytic subunit-like n=1 Tax=Choristoneura fumiferana TaxID=7141 RepID=UPI003D15DCFA